MILEVADFSTTDPADFEVGMEEVKGVIASADGYLGHTVQRSVETPGRYLLIVRWESIASSSAFSGQRRLPNLGGSTRVASRRRRR